MYVFKDYGIIRTIFDFPRRDNKKYDTEQPWQSKNKMIYERKYIIQQPRALRVSS